MVASDNIKEALALGKALAALRARTSPKMSQDAAGQKIGVTAEGWRKYEAGAPGLFKPATQRRVAEALGFTVDDLLAEYRRISGDEGAKVIRLTPPSRALPAQGMPIRGRIQAGAWLRTEDIWYEAEARTFPYAPDTRFPADAQWIEEVSGDSVNALGIFDGDLVHVVSIAAIGYSPVTGDLLKVERLRFQGREREVSLKELEMTPSGPIFWPRSTNPRWSEPLDLRAEVKHEEEIQVETSALVLNAIRRMWRPGGRF